VNSDIHIFHDEKNTPQLVEWNISYLSAFSIFLTLITSNLLHKVLTEVARYFCDYSNVLTISLFINKSTGNIKYSILYL